MKKLLFLVFVAFGFLFLFSSHASAATCTVKTNTCDESCIGGTVQANGDRTGGTTRGLVPCGKDFGKEFRCTRPGIVGGFEGTVRSDTLANATTLCSSTYNIANPTVVETPGQTGPNFACRCELYHTLILGKNIYIFIIWDIAAPLAGLLLVLGGVLLLLSGASTKMHELAKHMLWGAVWGLALIFGAYLIVNVVLTALGYGSAWNVF